MSKNRKSSLVFAACVLFTLGYVFCNVSYPLVIQKILDSLSAGILGFLPHLFFILLLFMAALVLCCRGMALTKAKYLNEMKRFYRENVLAGIFGSQQENLSSEREAELLSVFNNDIPMICTDYHGTILNIVYCFSTILFALSAIVSIHPLMAVLVVVNLGLLVVVPRAFRKSLQKEKQGISDSLKRYNVKLKDSIFCLPVIKSYFAEKEMLNNTNEAGEAANAASYAYSRTQANADLASMGIGFSSDFLLYLLGAVLILRGELTIGGLLAVTQITNVLANPITTLAYHFNTMQAVRPLRDAVLKLMNKDTKTETKTQQDPIRTIALNDVTVEKNGAVILDGVDLNLERGKKYLLAGRNGSGKSTLLKLLNRNIQQYEGEILINGEAGGGFRSDCVMVYQESYLFTAPVKDNITLYQPYEEEKLQKLIDFLGIQELVDKEDETAVHNFSGGEKQKVALCRALLKEPGFLLLDEALSAMDSASRGRMEDYLLQQDFALVNISHNFRREALERYDAIILMDNGKVVEFAPYGQLSEKGRTYLPLE